MLSTTFAEFESNLIRLRTMEGNARRKAAGGFLGRKPKLNAAQQSELYDLHALARLSVPSLTGAAVVSARRRNRSWAAAATMCSSMVNPRAVRWPSSRAGAPKRGGKQRVQQRPRRLQPGGSRAPPRATASATTCMPVEALHTDRLSVACIRGVVR